MSDVIVGRSDCLCHKIMQLANFLLIVSHGNHIAIPANSHSLAQQSPNFFAKIGLKPEYQPSSEACVEIMPAN